jgi:hypothetical protein
VVTNSFSSIEALGKLLWFGEILHKHNFGEKHFSYSQEDKEMNGRRDSFYGPCEKFKA